MKKLFKPSVNIEHLIEKSIQQQDTINKLKNDVEYYNDFIERILEELNKFDTSDNEFLQQLKKDYSDAGEILDKIKGIDE